jgi:hypothetical protein
VDHDRDVPRHLLEALLELQPQVLEPVEHPVGVADVRVVMPRGEAEGLGLDPGHPLAA